MDDQHAALMDALNEVLAAVAHGADQPTLTAYMTRLITLAEQHFASEERLLERFGFPGLDEHRIEHRAMLERLYEWHGKRPGAGYLTTWLENLRSWFHNHTEGVDREYGPWLRAHGVH
jgi:hemerythrin-like metal-binding protein